MKRTLLATELAFVVAFALTGIACVTQSPPNSNSVTTTTPSPISSASPTTGAVADASSIPVTLPVLDALFTDEAFKAALKSKLQLSDEQIGGLRNSASAEVAKLRQTNAEQQPGSAAEARALATESISNVIGAQKTGELLALAREHWIKGGEELEPGKTKDEITMLPGPNAVPPDTRIVVNVPAFRMDLFQNGSLIKSYKIGIGYPQFPLPTGLRKAQTIIFNPTWTPPDSPWVATMKNVTAGEKIAAGSPLNPLGPIKIPIGMPSLIHGGKSPSKIGTFASHGCVGLTNAQVKDFARTFAQAAGKDVSEKTIAAYLKDPTKTRVIKLDGPVPVELRYETIVVEDGKLHIYRDVYDQNTNTEENLRLALEKQGIKLEDLSEGERAEVLEALNAMSAHPKKQVSSKPVDTKPSPEVAGDTSGTANNQKAKTARKKPVGKNQKELVVEIAALSGKGYPGPVALDTGTGKPIPKGAQTASAQ